jgi:hypothetical protein
VAGTSYAILGLTPRSTGNQLIWIYDPSTGDGVTSDTTKTGRYFISFRGGATNEINKYDICTETWDILSYYPQFTTFTTGAMYAYDHKDRVYIASENATALMTGRVFYYDFVKNRMEQGGQAPYGFGTGVLSNRMAIVETIDGLKYLYLVRNSDSVFWRMLIFW